MQRGSGLFAIGGASVSRCLQVSVLVVRDVLYVSLSLFIPPSSTFVPFFLFFSGATHGTVTERHTLLRLFVVTEGKKKR